MFDISKKHLPTELLSIENLPYIYQSEYFSLAWGKQHRGFYVLPNGDKYVYNMPDHFNFYEIEGNEFGNTAWGDETELTIAPELLFENLKISTKQNGWLSLFKSKTLLKADVLKDLLKSKVKHYGQQMNDAGIKSNSLLIYDTDLRLYKRTLLKADGDRKVVNKYKHTFELINRFGTTS